MFLVIFVCLLSIISLFIYTKMFNISLSLLFSKIKFEIYYWILGSYGLLEDIIWKWHNKVELKHHDGRVAIVTGGSRGIGVEIVRMLANCNMTVIIACRNVKAGEEVARKISDENSNVGQIKVYELDVGSLESVRSFARNIQNDFPKIHILVNNAGIMFGPYRETVDGFESQFAVNYLGHFLLTHLLLPNLKRGAEEFSARIVNVSSCAHVCGSINFEDINMKNRYISSAAYAQSKLAQVLFTSYLNSLLKSEGANIEVFSIHPGIVNTDLFNDTPLKKIAPWLPMLFFKSPVDGAKTAVYASISEQLHGKGGAYLSNCRIVKPLDVVNDERMKKRLFEFSKKLTGIQKYSTIE